MTTDTTIEAPVIQIARPEFIRMPKPGAVCPWTGLGRSYLYQLSKEGKIKSFSVRKRNTGRGVRLICLDSVLEYLRGIQAQGNA